MTAFWDELGEDFTPDQETMAAAEQQQEAWREAALSKHPAASWARDLLVAPNQEAMESLAADIANRTRQPGPRTTADSREETPPVEESEQRTSAAIIAGFREGRTRPSDPDAASDYMTAKLREAAS
jgi:hypothetical protein